MFKVGAERITPPAPGESENAADDDATPDAAGGNAIEVGVVPGELRFDPSELTAEAGTVTFRFENTQATPHDFVIERNGERIAGTDLISNDSQDVTADLDAGEYTFICTPHESAGMTGTLTVS